MSKLMDLLEARQDLSVFKKLLHMLADYCERVPAASILAVYNKVLETGIKALPKDKRALAILKHILDSKDSSASKVQKLLNTRFAELPNCLKPAYLKDKKVEVAYWERGGKVYDKLFSMISAEDGKQGNWAALDGTSVKLVNLKEEN